MTENLPRPATPFIELLNVSRKHSGGAVRHVSFAAYAGRVTAMIGPHGSGKTNVLRILLGIDAADTGKALINGQPYAAYRDPMKVVGALPVQKPLCTRCSVRTYLRWKGFWMGVSGSQVDGITAMTGLQHDKTRKLRDLQAGALLRLRLAIALLSNPKALVIDEPMAGLNDIEAVWVGNFLKMQAARGMAVLITATPDSGIEDKVDDIVLIDHGSIIKEGSLEQLKGNNATFMQALPSLMN